MSEAFCIPPDTQARIRMLSEHHDSGTESERVERKAISARQPRERTADDSAQE
jgi:hypothetical protein